MITIKELRALTGKTQKAFAEWLNIPLRTIENWESETTKPPQYVVDLIEFKVDMEFKNTEIHL
jgi:DNA-binding transcriptional regulator YiaG